MNSMTPFVDGFLAANFLHMAGKAAITGDWLGASIGLAAAVLFTSLGITEGRAK